MKVYVTDTSALWFWRHCKDPWRFLETRSNAPLSDCPSTATELAACDINPRLFGNSKVRLMIPDPSLRFMRQTYDYKIHSKPLPPDAFCVINENLCVASPEYCCVQAAQKLSLPQAIELCMEFTGRYSLRPETSRGFEDRAQPLTTIDVLTHVAHGMHGEYGASKLLASLKYAQEHSRSPMETRCYLLMRLPIRYGSYGIRTMKLNARIELSPEEKRTTGRDYLEGDMYWPEHNLVVEYDGNEGHSSFGQRSRDATKRNVLIGQGKRVLCITAKEILDVHAFDAVVREIAKITNHKLRRFPHDWASRRVILRKELFASMQPEN